MPQLPSIEIKELAWVRPGGWFLFYRVLKNSFDRLVKKVQLRGARKIDPSTRSGQARRRRVGTGPTPTTHNHVGATPCGCPAIERNEANETFSTAC
jgi:hypothetical protein